MASSPVICPICYGTENGGSWRDDRAGASVSYRCDICGSYQVTGSVEAAFFAGGRLSEPLAKRVSVSHRIRSMNREGLTPKFGSDDFQAMLENARLPSPIEQATTLIRLIGDHVSETGLGLGLDPPLHAIEVGALNSTMFDQLRTQLQERGVLRPVETVFVDSGRGERNKPRTNYTLTLEGWERYEAERRGLVSGKYGFIAMKFGDEVLDPLVRDVIKPAVENAIQYRLVDLRDVARAGVIDNIMREQIRDSAFVLVDLTHENAGAYWEAGYAEGLGKPVIYLCERVKFDDQKTHFDTNHCTTIIWEKEKLGLFATQLIATLRRSLNLF